jgi:RimJ/RimL family protein N-acetyltransferase
MKLNVTKTTLKEIEPLRNLFLHENKFQFVHNKCHENGWADSYLFTMNETKIGYGSVWGKDKREDRDTIFEFYLIQPFLKFASEVYPKFIAAANVTFIEAQSNDLLSSSMLYEYARNINAEAILFEDNFTTNLKIPNVIFRREKPESDISYDPGEYVLEQNNEIVATGGFVRNYNLPYIDMFMEVKENFRQKGFGSFVVQELKKEAYLKGRVPAARCNIDNKASKATLLKAGLKVCGCILTGEIKKLQV